MGILRMAVALLLAGAVTGAAAQTPAPAPYTPPTYTPPAYTPPAPAFTPPAAAPTPADPFAPAPSLPAVPAADPFAPSFAPAAPAATPFAPATPPRTSIKQMFAGTLAAAATVTGVTLVAGLTQAITGGLTSWFSRRTGAPPAAPLPDPGTAAYAPAAVTPGPAVAPPMSAPVPLQPAYSPPAPAMYPPPGAAVPPAPAYAGSGTAAVPVYAEPASSLPQYFDASTGTTTTADPAFVAASTGGAAGGTGLFAGIAYEVHAVGAGGVNVPVDPATHEFRTGDRFLVHYRPALPGRMQVFNINPAGQQTLIDSAELAGGQLATLGPYEFAATKGDERLRLVLTPCATPQLLVATRDIVNVSGASAGPGLGMAACGPMTRSIDAPATRDIRKVALEGATAFALDPVTVQERDTGRFTPREVTILFRHR